MSLRLKWLFKPELWPLCDRIVPTVVPVFNTGETVAGGLASAGGSDPHFTMIDGSPTKVLKADGYPIPSPGHPGPWVGNGPNSQWLAPAAADADGRMRPGSYTYRTHFDLSRLDPKTAVLNGSWSADNWGQNILLNGVPLGIQHTGSNPGSGQQGYKGVTAFAIRGADGAPFRSGVNTLDFVIVNDRLSPLSLASNPTGLLVLGMVLSADPKPAPADRTDSLVKYLQRTPFDLDEFTSAVRDLGLPLSGNELALLLQVAGGGWDGAVSVGRPIGPAQARVVREVRRAAADKVSEALQEQPAGSGYVLTTSAASGLWQFYNQTLPPTLPRALLEELRLLKDEVIKVLKQNYGKAYWAGKVSPPNAARDANREADRLIPNLGSDVFATRAAADRELRGVLLKSITDGNFDGYKVLLARLRAAMNNQDAEVSNRAKAVLADPRVTIYIAMDDAGL